MGERGGFQRGFSAYNSRDELGLGWVSSEPIGRRGRCLGTTSCTGSRCMDGSVGGSLVRSEQARVQCGCG
jgi:hypothetical protein